MADVEGDLEEGARSRLQGIDASQLVTMADLDAVFETVALESLLTCFAGDHRALIAWWRRRVNGVMQSRIQFAAEIASVRGPKALLEKPQVTVGTIHSVKGGEADVVILFPDLSLIGYTAYQRFGPSRDPVIRMFYVGMTRARHALYLAEQAGIMAAHLSA